MTTVCRGKKRNLLGPLLVLLVVGMLVLFVPGEILSVYREHAGRKEYSQQVPGLIPHIIHQTWDTTAVPRAFVPWMRSWTRHHPRWQHWFWTPENVRCLLRRRYPQLAYIYESYPTALQRADVMRYFILHAFGGVYVDLDMECLRPLDPLLVNRSCLLSEEPHEHVYILNRRHGPANVMNGIMACRPGHALFKELLAKLPKYANNKDAVLTTGPFYLDSVLRRYLSNRTVSRSPVDDVTVIPPKYLLPTFDQGMLGTMQSTCMRFGNSTTQLIAVCYALKRRNYENKPSKQAYATHYWVHVVMKSLRWKTHDTVDIHDELLESRRNETQRIRGCV